MRLMKTVFTGNRLARKQLILILVFSSLLTLVGTAVQLYLEYRGEMDGIDLQLGQIEKGHLGSLTRSLWNVDDKQIRVHLNNILSLRDVVYLAIEERGALVFEVGERGEEGAIVNRRFPMIYNNDGISERIGSLLVLASFKGLNHRMLKRLFVILVTQGLKTFLVSLFILYIINRFVIRYLVEIARYAGAINTDRLGMTLSLGRKPFPFRSEDELDALASAINGMRGRILADIEERGKIERALGEAHRTFLTVLEGIDAMIYAADMETREILFMNRHMIDSFQRDMTGETCGKAFGGKQTPCGYCPDEHLVDASGNPTEGHAWQGEEPLTGRWYVNHARAIRWIDNRLVRLQVATDITRMREVEEQLRQARKMEAVGTLAGGIAHDFNNILGIMIGNTELAMEEVPQWSPARMNLDEIKTAGMRARGVVRQLLNFSRKSENSRKTVRLPGIIEEAVGLLRASIPATIDIGFEIQDGGGRVHADPGQIHQILINLCTNGFHAMEENGGTLVISLDEVTYLRKETLGGREIPPGRYVRLGVRDTGTGMASETLERIFDPYFTTKEVGKGTGMGLSIVHGIVASHGGAVSVESAPGSGTSVFVLLPGVDGEPEEERAPSRALPGGNERILFVDDEKPLVKMGKRSLERLGYRVEALTDSMDAVACFRSRPEAFDLVITDMTMPGLTGIQMIERIREISETVPVILCTGFSSSVDENAASEMGIDRYLEKPVDHRSMANAVREVLDARYAG